MEDLAVFTAPNQSGSFGKNFVKFQKKININKRRSGKCWPRPTASGSIFQTSVTVFHHTDLPPGK